MKIKFCARVQEDGTYRLPVIRHHHIATPIQDWTARERLALQGSRSQRIITDAMRASNIGTVCFDGSPIEFLDVNRVHRQTPGVTVTPFKNGFLDEVSFDVELAPRREPKSSTGN